MWDIFSVYYVSDPILSTGHIAMSTGNEIPDLMEFILQSGVLVPYSHKSDRVVKPF